MNNDKLKYCALTTIPMSMHCFVVPSAVNLAHNGYDVTIGCQRDEKFAGTVPPELTYLPLDIKRGMNLKGTVEGTWQLYRYFRKNKIQMVEYGTENVSMCASVAAWLARVPVRIYNHWGARYIGYEGLSRKFSFAIEKAISLFSTTVRQQSDKNMKMCIEDGLYPAKKVSVIGYGGTIGVDFNRFDISQKEVSNRTFREKHNIPMTDIVFGDVGAIRIDKGHNELLGAFKELSAKHRNIWLVLVGELFEPDAPNTDLMEFAKSLDKVIFTGRVDDVEHYVAAFDCLVHPSYREGFGMVIQEAGAMGVPYICANIPGPSEIGINGKTGLIVNKADTQDLQVKMQSLIDEPWKLKVMSEAMFNLTKERYERGIMLERLLNDRNKLRKENNL